MVTYFVSEVRKQREDRKGEQFINSQVLPPVTNLLQLLKVPQVSQTEPPVGDQVFKRLSLWKAFHIQTTTDSCP